MSLIILGGHERMQSRYRNLCRERGHSVKVYTRMPPQLDRHIGGADGIILFTSTVSHKMAGAAVDEARRKGIHVLRSHSSSATSLGILLDEMENWTETVG